MSVFIASFQHKMFYKTKSSARRSNGAAAATVTTSQNNNSADGLSEFVWQLFYIKNFVQKREKFHAATEVDKLVWST
jgi:hypothetical protein